MRNSDKFYDIDRCYRLIYKVRQSLYVFYVSRAALIVAQRGTRSSQEAPPPPSSCSQGDYRSRVFLAATKNSGAEKTTALEIPTTNRTAAEPLPAGGGISR